MSYLFTFPASLPATASSIEVLDGALDHIALAQGRLCEQFKSSTNFIKLLTALSTPAQDIENAIIQLLTLRTLDTATGAQLTMIGTIVGQDRDGLSDDDLRRYCRARIVAEHSSGTTNDIVTVAAIIVNDNAATINLRLVWDASAILEIDGIAVTSTVANTVGVMVELAKSAGVRIVTQYALTTPSSVFTLDIGPGLDQGHLAGQLE